MAIRRLVLGAGALLAGPVLFAATAARADTILKLAETATVSAHPDELAGELRAEAPARTAMAAQAAVNEVMQRALAEAKRVAAVTASTGAYSVWQEAQPQAGPGANPRASTGPNGLWRATQSLLLSSHDGPALIGLVGSLQAQGLSVGQLAWQLSPEADKAAREAATQRALTQLRGRAEQVAAVLGLTFGSFREVSLNRPPEPRPLYAMRAAAASPAAAFPEPSAEPGMASVSATVEAEVVLLAPPATGAPAR